MIHRQSDIVLERIIVTPGALTHLLRGMSVKFKRPYLMYMEDARRAVEIEG